VLGVGRITAQETMGAEKIEVAGLSDWISGRVGGIVYVGGEV
jgi:hypothetical protein